MERAIQDVVPLWKQIEPSFVARAYFESSCKYGEVPNPDQYQTTSFDRMELRSHILIRFNRREHADVFDIENMSCEFLSTNNQFYIVMLSTRCRINENENDNVNDYSKTVFIIFKSESESTDFVRQVNLLQSTPCLEEFHPIATIGRGKWGKVIVCQRLVNDEVELYAVKEIQVRDKKSLKHIQDERLVLGLLPDHPFVVKMHFAISKGTHVYILMDFVVGGDLFSAMRKFRMVATAPIFYASQIVLVLDHLREHKIVHRDIKPENLLLDQFGNIKLADFGLAKNIASTGWTETVCGTNVYMAPEVLNHQKYSYSVDIWQLGCIVFELYAGCSPFYNPSYSQAETRNQILKCQVHYPLKMPAIAKDFLTKIFVFKPSERLGCTDGGCCSNLKHETFFSCVDWDALLSGRVKAPIQSVQDGMDVLENFDEEFLVEEPEFECSHSQFKERHLQSLLWGFNYSPSFPSPILLCSNDSKDVLPLS